MATLGFLRRDFDVFAIEGCDARMAKIDELVAPRLSRLAAFLAPELSRGMHTELFTHTARHPRRSTNPPGETWTAFGPSPAGYKRFAYMAVFVSRAGVHARAVLESSAGNRPAIAHSLKSVTSNLEKSFRGTRIQEYRNWNWRNLPESKAPSSELFAHLADTLETRSGALDVGFGWPVRDALELDRAELLDALRELEPLYRALLSPS